MKFCSPHADLFIPDNHDETMALSRCTHLTIGTHPDDVELLGMNGIQLCYEQDDKHFVGVVVTNGAGSPRSGDYADVTNDEMVEIRKQEQINAATIGQYSAQIQLGYPSDAVKKSPHDAIADIKAILLATQPEILYLHNPLDRHDSHRAILRICVEALRQLDPAQRPHKIFGVEVWRSLDFLPEALRIALPTDIVPNIAEKLIEAFKSQVYGGKRYDLAFLGRTLSNATFAESHHVDQASALSFAMDLNPLIEDKTLDQDEFAKRTLQALIDQI
jgi:LmbE family N-acetylglucosaminyl deacetylase